MKQNEEKIKGHGYLRKTKVGLASGIVLGATLLFGSGVVSADEVTAPSNGDVASAQTNDTKDVVVDNGLTKVAEDAKSAGLQVEKEPTKNIGTANTEAEAEALQKKAEAEVDAQKNTIQEAQKKFDEENKSVDKRLENLKKVLHDTRTYPRIATDLAYIQDKDYLNGKVKIGEIKSSKGSVDYLNVQSDTLEINVDDKRPEELNKVYSLGKTDKPKETLVNFKEGSSKELYTNHPDSPITDKYHEKVIPVFVSPNETVTYRVEFADDSEMAKMGIKYREVKFTLKNTGTNNKDDKVIAMLSPYGNHGLSGGFAFRWEGKDNVNGQPFEVENGYNYLDKNGKVIDKKALGQQWINKLTLKGATVDPSFFPDAPTTATEKDEVNDGGVYKDEELTLEAGGEYLYKANRKFKPNPLTWGGVSLTHLNVTKPKENSSEGFIKKQSEKVAYHLVSYTKNTQIKNIDGYEPSPKHSRNVENPKGETVRVYKIVKGDVEVRYIKDDKERTVLKEPVADTTQAKVGTKYDTTDHKPQVITKDGVSYELVRTEGKETGDVVKGKTVVTYVYREVQKPVTIHIDKEGNPVAPKEDGTKPFKDIEGYKPEPKDPKNVEDPKGVTVRVYEKVTPKPETPQETPKTPEAPTPQPQQPTQAVAKATLPQTGEVASVALSIAGLGLLGLTGFATKKKRED